MPFRGNGPLNRVSFNFPNLLVLNSYPGGTLGLNYERYLLRSGHISVEAGARLFNVGIATLYGGKTGTKKHNERGSDFCAAGLYHPLGNRRRVDLNIGGGFLSGSLRITESVLNTPSATRRRELPLAVAFAQIGLNVNNYSRFAFGIVLRGGPVISGGSGSKNYVEFGLNVGTQF